MKRIATIIFTIISLFSLFYYTIQYYFNGELILKNNGILLWTILMMIIFITLIIGIINNYEIMSAKKQLMLLTEQNVSAKKQLLLLAEQNEKLIYLVENLSDKQDNDSDEIIETIRNSRSVSLDILNKIKRGDK